MWAFGELENHSDNKPHISHPPAMHSDQLEGLAAEILVKTGLKHPVSALSLADVLGLRLVPVDGPYDEGKSGIEIRFNTRASYRDRQEFIAGCCARWVIMDAGHYPTEVASRRLARALILPRAAFVEDLASQRDLAWLLRRHPHASRTMVCARLGDVGVKIRAIRSATSARESAALERPEPASKGERPQRPACDLQPLGSR